MTKVLVLDESGTIDSSHKTEKYFVLGGLLYDLDNLDLIKSSLLPAFATYKDILNVNELKSNSLTSGKSQHNLIYGAALGVINNVSELIPIIYILDKSGSYVIREYNKKSFKYNKLLEFMIKDLITDKLINNGDELLLLLDHLDLSSDELINLKTWLPSNLSMVKRIEIGKSHEYIFLQAADLISGIPKLKGTTPRQIKKDPKVRLLSNCFLHVFPKSKAHLILSDNCE